MIDTDETENNPLLIAETPDNESIFSACCSRLPVWVRGSVSTVVSVAYFTITKTGKNAITSLFSLNDSVSDAILTGFGVVASITTGVFFYRATKTLDLSLNTIPKKMIV